MKNIKKIILNMRIRNKLISIFLIIILFISFSLGIFFYTTLSDEMLAQAKKDNLIICKQIGESIKNFQKTIKDFSSLVIMQKSVQLYAKIPESNFNALNESGYQRFENMTVFINNFFAATAGNYLSYVTFYSKNGLVFASGCDMSGGYYDYKAVQESDYYKKALKLMGRPFWTLVTPDQPFLSINKNPKVAFIRTIIETDRYTESGLMILYVDISTLKKLYLEDYTADKFNVILLNENNELIYKDEGIKPTYSELLESDISYPQQNEGFMTVGTDKGEILVTYYTIPDSGWKVLTVMPISTLQKKVQTILSMAVLITLICLFLAFALSAKMASFVTKPINTLLKSMEKFQVGNFDERVHFDYNDEIGKLGKGYNVMAERILQLINNTYKLQLGERQAELRALQSQINPHFLYNTLDSIFWKSQKNNDNELSEMVYALSQFFRLSLNSGKEIITVEDEKKLIESYLLLQKRRYLQRLTYLINIGEGILQYKIPKFVLQPFVENALIHGILVNEQSGKVEVTGRLENENIVFVVEDDGVGMGEVALKELLASFNSEENTDLNHGYAMRNVRERLKIIYGDSLHFLVESWYGKGTRITITFPSEITEIKDGEHRV